MRLIHVVLLSFLLIAGCKTDVTLELFSSDLRRVMEDGKAQLTASTLMAIEIPSAKECEKYTSRIVGIMKDVVPDFQPRECKREGMDSFLLAEIQSPLVPSMEAWRAADTLFGVVILVKRSAVVLALNRDKFSLLNERTSDKFSQTLDLAKSKVTMILHNDERTPQTYGLGGAFVNGQPVYERKYFEIKRRGKATILLSNVGAEALAKHGQVILLDLKS